MSLSNCISILDSDSSSDNDSNSLFPDISHSEYLFSVKSFVPLSLNDMLDRLNGKRPFPVENLYFILDFIKHHLNDSRLILIPQNHPYFICSDKKKNINPRYKQTARVGDHIQKLIECGILYKFNNYVSFINHKACVYYVYKENFDIFYQYCLSLHKKLIEIKAKEQLESQKHKRGPKKKGKKDAYYLTTYFSKCKISLAEYSYDELDTALYKHYPDLWSNIDARVKKLNNNLLKKSKIDNKIDYEKELIVFNPNYYIDKKNHPKNPDGTYYIRKIGIRASCGLCNKKSIKKAEKECAESGKKFKREPGIEYREDYLDKRFGKNNWEEYDIKGSVPRIAHANLNLGDGMGNLDEDVYKTIFEQFVPDVKDFFDSSVNSWEDARDFFKKLFMRLYFDTTPKMILYHIRQAERNAFNKNPKVGMPFEDAKKRGANLLDLITKWKNAVDSYCYKRSPTDTSVFFDESCIYINVRITLLKMDVDVVQIYDGFYFRKGTIPNNMNEIVSNAENNYRFHTKAALNGFLINKVYSLLAENNVSETDSKQIYKKMMDIGTSLEKVSQIDIEKLNLETLLGWIK